MLLDQITKDTLAEAAKVIGAAQKDPNSLRKGVTVTGISIHGVFGVNLQQGMHSLLPLLSPFRGSIGRVNKPGSNSDAWKNITSVTMPKGTVAENAAASQQQMTWAQKSAAYKVLGLGDVVSREAQAASQGFDDALALATSICLLNAMRIEEQYMLGGNITPLAGASANVPGTPTVAATATTAGGITASTTTYYAKIVALTLPAANRVVGGMDRPAAVNANNDSVLVGNVRAQTTSPFPITDGLSAVSAEGNSGSISPSAKCMRISWTPVPGAAAYAVFVGTTTGSANLALEAIVTQSHVALYSLAGTGIKANDGSIPTGTISSGDTLAYDGMIAQMVESGSGSYVKRVNTALSASSTTGEITELQDAFQSLYDTAKIGKFRVVVGAQESRSLTAKSVVSNSLNIIAQPNGSDRASLVQGAHIGSIMNAITGDLCPVETAPWLVGGNILILPTEVPYAHANISQPFQMAMGYDWERIDYAQTTSSGPQFPFEVRSWGVLEGLFLGGCGYLYDITRG